jgi:hypothetical protein
MFRFRSGVDLLLLGELESALLTCCGCIVVYPGWCLRFLPLLMCIVLLMWGPGTRVRRPLVLAFSLRICLCTPFSALVVDRAGDGDGGG